MLRKCGIYIFELLLTEWSTLNQILNGLWCFQSAKCKLIPDVVNEEKIITGYPIDGAMGSSVGGRVRKLSVVCLNNNAIVARGILVTILQCMCDTQHHLYC